MKKLIFILILLFSMKTIAAQTYVCKFTSFSDPTGIHNEVLKLKFVVNGENDARMIGNNGSSEVIYLDKGDRITFIEITAFGNVTTTTIDKKMNAVHSRNTVDFIGELIPSQYYGSCRER